ncbi:hypothetical protein [Streptomyces sp. NPDC057718]|uniref:hypothetical protein n=1 Tax=Streptomyces sp. NPDC057718 TaxID=3346225 RepID=UPI00369006D3
MDNQAEVRDFLRTRRDRITPEQAGIVAGGRRRLPGLRREEVAMLAGMSSDYYAKMERGNLADVSPEVLDGPPPPPPCGHWQTSRRASPHHTATARQQV